MDNIRGPYVNRLSFPSTDALPTSESFEEELYSLFEKCIMESVFIEEALMSPTKPPSTYPHEQLLQFCSQSSSNNITDNTNVYKTNKSTTVALSFGKSKKEDSEKKN